MKNKQILNCLLTIAILLCALTNARAQDVIPADANPPAENVILQWNRVLNETIRTPGVHPSATIFIIQISFNVEYELGENND